LSKNVEEKEIGLLRSRSRRSRRCCPSPVEVVIVVVVAGSILPAPVPVPPSLRFLLLLLLLLLTEIRRVLKPGGKLLVVAKFHLGLAPYPQRGKGSHNQISEIPSVNSTVRLLFFSSSCRDSTCAQAWRQASRRRGYNPNRFPGSPLGLR